MSNFTRASPVGDRPGITRHIAPIVKIHTKPDLYLIDTPGVLFSQANSTAKLQIALTGGLEYSTEDDQLTRILAKYLLDTLNHQKQLEYMKVFKFDEPVEGVDRLLHEIARRKAMKLGGGLPDLNRAALMWIRLYRQGKLGKFVME